ncbi:MAG TPA: DUF6089 family protein [Bacteroidales bacterium]|nr:DUF6089 family protein [Bacteroidales bacterium]HPT21529.1 DUF6089 family protein [Bacteroidales bacterium]
MKRSVLVILIICLLDPLAEAQLWKMRRFEAVAGIGPSLFFGDVGGYSHTKNILGLRDMSFLQTRFNLNGNMKYRITQDINVRLSLSYGLLHATDERGSNEKRGFEATTSVFEPAILGEYYFIKNRAEDSYLFAKGRKYGLIGMFKSLDFYVFTGIGGLNYNVKTNDKLSGYVTNTGGFTAVFPVGLGATLVYSPDFNFGFEVGRRYSFSDNLDGYTSQYSSANDVYYFLNFTFTYKLKSRPNNLVSFRR